MADFLAKSPTLDSNWRAVVLFGRNEASYKFALAKTLLEMAERPDDRVTLEDLAGPYARHLCEHLSHVDKQATSRSSQFLDTRRSFNKGELPEDKLGQTTVRLGFNNVVDAFHVVGSGSVPVGSSMIERKSEIIRKWEIFHQAGNCDERADLYDMLCSWLLPHQEEER
jgi:hypothetical protein